MRRPRTRVAALALSVALAGAACGDEQATTATTAASDSAATESAAASPLPAVSGSTAIGDKLIEFNSLEGQDAVLWFWAPW